MLMKQKTICSILAEFKPRYLRLSVPKSGHTNLLQCGEHDFKDYEVPLQLSQMSAVGVCNSGKTSDLGH